jgi:hypothetical protein
MKKIVFILACIVCTMTYGQSMSWTNQGAIQEGIYGAEAFVSYSNIYIVGGYSDSMQASVNWVRTYDSFLNKVETIGYTLKKRKNFVAAIKDKLFYFAGGEDDTPVGTMGTIETFQNVLLTASLLDSGLCFNRTNGVGTMVNGHLYILGGIPAGSTIGALNPYLFEYDPTGKTIGFHQDSVFAPTCPTEGQMTATVGANIFTFGGINNTVMNDIYLFNTGDHSFRKMNISLQQPRAGGQAVYDAANHQIYVFGGFNESSTALNTGEVYYVSDTILLYLRPLAPMNYARKNFMSVLTGNGLYAFGGIDEAGHTLRQVELLDVNGATNICGDASTASKVCELMQNYPNPFNPSTKISYKLSGTGMVSLKVFDVLGREVCRLVEAEQAAGNHAAVFNADKLTSGVYFYQLRVRTLAAGSRGLYTETKKMLLIR